MDVTLQQEIADRRQALRFVADYFRARPYERITQHELKLIGGGDACRNRVRECVRWFGMDIETISTTYKGDDGKVHRGLAEYRFRPSGPALGPEAGTYRDQVLF